MSDKENNQIKKLFSKTLKQIKNYDNIISKIDRLSPVKQKFISIRTKDTPSFWPASLTKSQKNKFDRLVSKAEKILDEISKITAKTKEILLIDFTTSHKFFPDYRVQFFDIVSRSINDYRLSKKLQSLPYENLKDLIAVKNSFLRSMLNFINAVRAPLGNNEIERNSALKKSSLDKIQHRFCKSHQEKFSFRLQVRARQ